jgi:glycosyltransferase involved in cell wall biosynthesis
MNRFEDPPHVLHESCVGTTESAPLVSIIVPTYNRRHIVTRAIQSVLNQTYQHYEILVIDDGSTDGTASWLVGEFPTVHILRMEANKGASAARNAGLAIAKGDIIAFLDSDDQWHATYLARQVISLSNHPLASWSYTKHCNVTTQGQILEVSVAPLIPSDLRLSLLLTCFVHSMSLVAIPRRVFELAGMYLSEQFTVCEDLELYMRLLTYGLPVYIDDSLVTKYHYHDGLILDKDCGLWLQDGIRFLDMFFSRPENLVYRRLRSFVEQNLRANIEGARRSLL